MVDTGSDLDGVIRRGGQVLIHTGGPAELGIPLVLHDLVPVSQRRCQRGGIDVQLFRQAFDRIRLNGNAALHILFDSFQVIPQLLVKDDVGIAAFLGQFRRGYRVAGQQFVGKAYAALVHQDRTIAADRFGNQDGGCLFHGGMELDLLNIHQVGSQSLRHHNTVSGRTGRVGSHRTLQVRPVGGIHFLIGPESAAGQDHGFSIDGIDRVRTFRLHAGDLSLCVSQQFRRRGFQHHIHAQLIQFRGEAVHQVCADAGSVLRRVNTVHRRAAGEGDLWQFRPDGIQPVNGTRGAVGHHRHQGGIVQRMTALHGIGCEQRVGVFDSLFLLIMGFGRVHAAGSFCGVAAHVGHLLQDHKILSGLLQHDGCGHPRAARADDHNISINRFFSLGTRVLGVLAVGVQYGNVRAGLLQG